MLQQIRFSFFNRANEVTPTRDVTFSELRDLIKTDAGVINATNALRTFKQSLDLSDKGDKAKYQRHKLDNLSGFTPAGVFTSRASSECIFYSQIVHMDLDKLDVATMNRLNSDMNNRTGVFKSALFAFVSPSGNGYKIFHAIKTKKPIEPENSQTFHKMAFDTLLAAYIEHDADLMQYADKSISDLARLCYVCNDPHFYDFSTDFTPFEIDEKAFQTKVERHKQFVNIYNTYSTNIKQDAAYSSKTAILAELYNFCEKNKKSITSEYGQWIRVLFALKKELNDADAYLFAKQFSQLDKSFDETEFNVKWASMKNMRYDIAPSIATILYYAKELGFKSKLNNEITTQSKFTTLIHSLAKNNVMTRHNLMNANLEMMENNEFASITDNQMNHLYTFVNGQVLSKNDLESFLDAASPKYNPVSIFLSMIPQWDGKDRKEAIIDTLNLKSDKEFYSKMLYQWCLLFFAQLTQKERNPYIIILQGGQGSGKTNWIEDFISPLFTGELSNYFLTKNLDFNQKDDMIFLAHKFIVFNDELQNVTSRKADVEKIKSVLSSKEFELRKAYGRYNQHFKRHASMIGTVNPSDIIRDDTGARRFLIIPVQEVDFLTLRDDKEMVLQFWAQIYHDFLNGAQLYFDKAFEQRINDHNRVFEIDSEEDAVIREFLSPGNYTRNQDWMTPLDLFNGMANNQRLKFPDFSRKLNKHFDKALKKQVNRNGKVIYVWNLKVTSGRQMGLPITTEQLN